MSRKCCFTGKKTVAGRSIARRLMQTLGIKKSDLIDCAYIDLLTDGISGSGA